MLEEGERAGRVNLITNGDFETLLSSGSIYPQDWTMGGDVGTSSAFGVKPLSEAPATLTGKCFQFRGEPSKPNMYIQQDVAVSGNAGDAFVLGGWSYAKSAPTDAVKTYGFVVRFKNNNAYSSPQLYMFNAEEVGWQYATFAVIAPNAYQGIRVEASFASNINVCQYSNLYLYKESYGRSYVYDANGNVVSAGTYAGQKENATYDSYNNMTSYTPAGRGASEKYELGYGSGTAPKYRLPLTEKSPLNVYTKRAYHISGMPISEQRIKYDERDNPDPTQIRTETGYTTDYNYAVSWKDARGNVAARDVNPRTGTTTWTSTPGMAQVWNAYDLADRPTATEATQSGEYYRNAYTYANDRLETVKHNTTGSSADVTYTIGYDALGNQTTVMVGSQTLSTNAYANDRSRNLTSVTAGNGGKVEYTYDDYNRLTSARLDSDNGKRVTYTYGNRGNVEKVTTTSPARVVKPQYDLADRLIGKVETESGSEIYRTTYTYNAQENLESFKERVRTAANTYANRESTFTYDSDDRLTQARFGTDARRGTCTCFLQRR